MRAGTPISMAMTHPASPLSPSQISEVIELAWSDWTSFEMIEAETGLTEPQVIALMRQELKPSSFRLWRKRASGRTFKHGRKHAHQSGKDEIY